MLARPAAVTVEQGPPKRDGASTRRERHYFISALHGVVFLLSFGVCFFFSFKKPSRTKPFWSESPLIRLVLLLSLPPLTCFSPTACFYPIT